MTPTPKPNVITSLLELQDKLDDVNRDSEFAIGPAKEKYALVREALYDRRRELVMHVPHFWLKALTTHPALSLLITDVDSRILSKLVDVDVTPVHNRTYLQGFDIVFTFARNEWFEDVSLVKRYNYTDERGRVVGVHPIRWKADKHRAIAAGKGAPAAALSGFFWWIAEDTSDALDLGDLIRQEVHPRALELFFGTYAMINQSNDVIDFLPNRL